MKATVFLGGGRITSALVAGLRLATYRRPIVVHDRHSKKLQQLKQQYGVIVEPDLHRAVESARVLIIAVRPDSVHDLLKEIGMIHRPLTAVSLAAGIPVAKLQAGLERPVRWARAMPSPLCRSGRGLTALTFGARLSNCRQGRSSRFVLARGCGAGNSREPARCVHRHLFQQPRLSRAGGADSRGGKNRTGPQERATGRCSRFGGWHSGVARR